MKETIQPERRWLLPHSSRGVTKVLLKLCAFIFENVNMICALQELQALNLLSNWKVKCQHISLCSSPETVSDQRQSLLPDYYQSDVESHMSALKIHKRFHMPTDLNIPVHRWSLSTRVFPWDLKTFHCPAADATHYKWFALQSHKYSVPMFHGLDGE